MSNIHEAIALKIADDLALPLDAVTETFGIVGIRGSGKSYSASVVMESMLEAGLHLVAVDPLGALYGLTISADGSGPGYRIAIFGGEHAD